MPRTDTLEGWVATLESSLINMFGIDGMVVGLLAALVPDVT